MSMRMRPTCLAATGFLLFSTAAFAQLCVAEGDVKAADGGPEKNALIKFDRTDSPGKYQVKTDKKGHFFDGGLPHGTFRVSVWVDGKEMDSVSSIQTQFSTYTVVNFDLQSVAQHKAMLAKASQGSLSKTEQKSLTAEDKASIQAQEKQREEINTKNKELNDTFTAGRDAYEQKHYDEAIADLTKASTMDANQNAIWVYLAQSYAAVADLKSGADRQDAQQKACDAFQKALAIKDDPAVRSRYAMVLYKMNKTSEAQAELDKAAAADPAGGAKYYYNVGALLIGQGQQEPAGAAFKKAIELDPNFAEAQYQYAVYLSSKMPPPGPDGKVTAPPGMAEALQKYLALAPNGPNAESARSLLALLGTSIQTGYQTKGKKH